MKKKRKTRKKAGFDVKKAATIALTVLLAASVIFLAVKAVKKPGAQAGAAKVTGTKVIAYYFHGTHRCWSCNTIEEYSREAIEGNFKKELEAGKLEFVSLDVQREENRHFPQKYNMPSKALVVVLFRDGKEVKYEPLQDVWTLLRDKPKFIEYVKQGVKRYLDEV